jgi:hypothetical protein
VTFGDVLPISVQSIGAVLRPIPSSMSNDDRSGAAGSSGIRTRPSRPGRGRDGSRGARGRAIGRPRLEFWTRCRRPCETGTVSPFPCRQCDALRPRRANGVFVRP